MKRSINDVVQKSLKLVHNMISISNIEINISLADGLPVVFIDINQIQEVLINLITNAIQAASSGDELRIATRLGADADHVEIEVRDTGKGIPPEFLPHVFDPFFTTKEASGTGLGSVCQLRHHPEPSGQHPGPQRTGRGNLLHHRIAGIYKKRRQGMSGHRIIVIDDENIVGKMIKATFEKDGYYVETFLSAAPALERLKAEPFDVIITDLKMKGIDGMEVLRIVKKESPATKVIMITAFASMDSAIEAVRGKVDDFFPKPFKIKDLKACIERLLGP